MEANETKGSVYIPITQLFQRENWYEEIFYKYTDPRVRDFLFLQSPGPMALIVAAYLVAVPVLSKVMESRSPLNLRNLIFLYNFSLVALSGYMCFEFFYVAFKMGYSLSCQPVDWDYKTDDLSMRMVNINWLFFFSKIIELADTIFFILRKKNNQVTFLHVYHHATMVINWWMAAKYIPVGQCFFVGVVNSFIHTLMYAYYALACLGPSMQKYLWWKKYMTSMQLVQFLLVVSHTGNALYINTSCDYPFLYNFITFYYSWSMMFLFLNFYYHTYISNRNASKLRSSVQNSSKDSSKHPSKHPSNTHHPLANGDTAHANGSHANGDVVRRKVVNGHSKK